MSRVLEAAGLHEVLVHTGQHFDDDMSSVFFRELGLRPPHYELGINGGSHGQMTGRMLERVEEVILREQPSAVLVYGDTNSTLAGALAAAKVPVPAVHVEAGLRSFRRAMPEEVNRVLTDHVSSLLCCSSRTSVDHLRREGFQGLVGDGALVTGDEPLPGRAPWVANVGDVMFDVQIRARDLAAARSTVREQLGVRPGDYAVLTIHRAENTTSVDALTRLLDPVTKLAARMPVVFALHPRTEALLRAGDAYERLAASPGMVLTRPLPYLDFLHLQAGARAILTDSGGMQKEAFWLRVPCLTLRDETEWPETTAGGWNRIMGSAPGDLGAALDLTPDPATDIGVFGRGDAAERIVRLLGSFCAGDRVRAF
ncbi:MAG: non-hydrolyzing UDP-N-acetylglucosamine 2-epimerase [Vicinamibacterales bacterium]